MILGFVPMDSLRRDASKFKVLDDFICAMFRPGKYEDSFDRSIFQDILEEFFFIVLVDEVDALIDLLGCSGWRSHFHFRRISEDTARELDDSTRHGRREK